MSTTSSLQNSLFEAMKIFSDYSISNSDATVTVEGRVSEIVDAGSGRYSIEYLGNTFVAHSANNATYAVGDNVYILIPEGNFGKEKVILGTVTASTDLYITNLNELGYNEVSDNLISNTNIIDNIIKMSSYATTEKTGINILQNESDKDLFGKLIQNYLKDYDIFKLSYSVKTSLETSQQTGGNYGVSLHIPLIAEGGDGNGVSTQIWKVVSLDAGNILGDPYRLTSWSPQSVYFSIDSQYKYDTSRIPYLSYFCYDFPQNEQKKDVIDIEIKDINVNVVTKLTEEQTTGYSLSLKASQGEYFSTNFYSTTKIITPTLKVSGKITSIKDAIVYWFKENAEIKSDSESYLPYGGYGWECLNEKTNIAAAADGSTTFDYITNALTLKVSKEDVPSSTRYKCVVIYKEKTISSIIKLKNLVPDSSLELSTKDGVNVFLKNTGFVNLIAKVFYSGVTDAEISKAEEMRDYIKLSWSRHDKNGTYLNDQGTVFKTIFNNIIEDGKFVTEVKFPVSLIEDSNIVYCSAKHIYETDDHKFKEELIGTEEIIVSTSAEDGFNLTINGDDVIYKYDTDGDSPMGAAYDGPSTSKVTSITALTYTLRKKDGRELTEDEYACAKYTWKISKNGMFTISDFSSSDDDYYYVTGYGHNSSLAYGINSRYNISKAKNSSIILTVEFQDETFSSSASISFIKEGMSGSNGSAYAAMLVWGGISETDSVPYGTLMENGLAKKLKFWYNTIEKKLYYFDFEKKALVKWEDAPRYIYPQVWENSVKLDKSAYDIEWSMFDKDFTNSCFKVEEVEKGNAAKLTLSKDSLNINDIYCNTLQAKITVKGQSSISNQNEIIYAYYPLEITLTNFKSDGIIPSLDGGFSEVIYASDGTNPSWDETNDFIVNDNNFVDNEFSDFFKTEWDSSNHLEIKDKNTDSSSKKIKPSNKFDDGNSKNYVKTKFSLKKTKTELEKDKKQLEENKEKLEKENIQIENSKIKLQEFGEKWTHKTWKEKLESVKTFLEKRTLAVNYLTTIKEDSLKKINKYLELQKQNGVNVSAVCGDLQAQLQFLDSEISSAVQELQQLGFSTNVKEIIVLKEITLNDYQKDAFKSVSVNFFIAIKNLIDDVNKQVSEYNNSRTSLIKLNNLSKILNTYTSLIKDIEKVCNILYKSDKDILQRYKTLGEKCFYYLQNVYSVVSYRAIEKIINDIYNILLSGIFIKEENKLVLSTAAQEEFEEKINQNNKSISENQEKIDFYTRLLQFIKDKGNDPVIIHIRPVVLYFNRYEMSNINAWDGNKIETGDGSYLLAPQVGAGAKEEDGSFTGIIMGLRNKKGHTDSDNLQKGLFGYHQGVKTITLDAEKGTAIFGKAGNGGQIIIDPNTTEAMLYSSIFFKSYDKYSGLPLTYNTDNYNKQGLMINLSKPEIRFGNGNFVVNSSGDTTIAGSNNIIGGWKVTNTQIYSNVTPDNGRITLDSGATVTGVDAEGNKTYSYTAGKIYSHKHDALTSTGQGFYIGPDGISIDKQFKVTNKGSLEVGNLTSNHWTINGDSNKSYIKYNDSGSTNSVYIGTDKITLGSYFTIENNGKMSGGSGDSTWNITKDGVATFQNLVANNSGFVGGWTIGTSSLKGGNLVLNNDGSINGSNWSIAADGTATFGNVTTFSKTANFTNQASFTSGNNTLAAFNNGGFSLYTGSIGNSNNTVSSGGGLSLGSGSVGGNSVSSSSLGLKTDNFKINDEEPITYIKKLAVESLNVAGDLTFQGKSCKWQSLRFITRRTMTWNNTPITYMTSATKPATTTVVTDLASKSWYRDIFILTSASAEKEGNG